MDRIRDLKHVHSFTQEATVVSRRYCQSISAVPGTDKLFPLLLLSVLVKIPLLLLPPLATGQQACPPFTRIRVMKPSSKCTNWIWSVMHMFWLANRTHISTSYMRTSTQHYFISPYVVCPEWRIHNACTWITVGYVPLKVCCGQTTVISRKAIYKVFV